MIDYTKYLAEATDMAAELLHNGLPPEPQPVPPFGLWLTPRGRLRAVSFFCWVAESLLQKQRKTA